MSKERLQYGLAAQYDFDAAMAAFQAAVARRGGAVLDRAGNAAVDKARSAVHAALDSMLMQREVSIEEMLKPKSERKAG